MAVAGRDGEGVVLELGAQLLVVPDHHQVLRVALQRRHRRAGYQASQMSKET